MIGILKTVSTKNNVIHSVIRFLFMGMINTGAGCGIYLILLCFMSYEISYTIAFIFGIIISYYLNQHFVFRAGVKKFGFLFFPLIYLLQYLLGLIVVFVSIEMLSMPEFLAPLLTVIIFLPFNYLLSRYIFSTDMKSGDPELLL